MTAGLPFKPVPFRTHVQVALLPEDTETIVTYTTNELALFRYVMERVQDGCAVTIKPNEKGGFTCSSQAIVPTHKASGLAIYANAPTPQESVAVLVFKLESVGPKLDWSEKGGMNTDSKYR